jgi:hypothetical protein
MSQRDLTAELRASRIVAPAEVRDRVRQIAATDSGPAAPRFTWRRALVVALPVAAAIASAVIFTRPADQPTPTAGGTVGRKALDSATSQKAAVPPFRVHVEHGAVAGAAGSTLIAPAPTRSRAVKYGAYLALRVRTAAGVSDGVKRALHVTALLGGYPTSVHANSHGQSASADLTIKVPREHVQQALSKLSALGTITSEQVDVRDVQGSVDTTERTIARLQHRLRDLRRETQTPSVRRTIATITAQVVGLQRAKADALRAARYATLNLHLQTKQAPAPHRSGHGPLHGLGVAFHWFWIGAVYALALGLPLLVLALLVWLAVRTVRRRREDALLSS